MITLYYVYCLISIVDGRLLEAADRAGSPRGGRRGGGLANDAPHADNLRQHASNELYGGVGGAAAAGRAVLVGQAALPREGGPRRATLFAENLRRQRNNFYEHEHFFINSEQS